MVKIKGATKADKQSIDAARAVNKAEATRRVTRTTRTDETAEAKTTTAAKKAAADKQFERADLASQETLQETQARMAARGF